MKTEEAVVGMGFRTFLLQVIERMSPCLLRKCSSRSADGSLYERHWQNEFYRYDTERALVVGGSTRSNRY